MSDAVNNTSKSIEMQQEARIDYYNRPASPYRNLDIARCEQQLKVARSGRYRAYLRRCLRSLKGLKVAQ